MLERVLIFEEHIKSGEFPECNYSLTLKLELFDAFLCTNDYEHFKHCLHEHYRDSIPWMHPDNWPDIEGSYNIAML